MTIHELARRLKGFDVRQAVHEAIVETSPDIVKLNQGQMFLGKKSDGSDINPPYTERTVEIKQAKGQPFDRVTLRDTSDFWNSIKVDVNSDTYTIDATDVKTNALTRKYGNKILGLSKEGKSEEYIPNYFYPALQEKITAKLGLKFS